METALFNYGSGFKIIEKRRFKERIFKRFRRVVQQQRHKQNYVIGWMAMWIVLHVQHPL